MHEGRFAEEIVEAIMAQWKARKGCRPKRIVVGVGEMLHLVPESVRFHFECCVRGTPLARTELDLREIPLEVLCKECGRRGGVLDHHMPLCGQCGSRELRVLNGNDVIIERMEL